MFYINATSAAHRPSKETVLSETLIKIKQVRPVIVRLRARFHDFDPLPTAILWQPARPDIIPPVSLSPYSLKGRNTSHHTLTNVYEHHERSLSNRHVHCICSKISDTRFFFRQNVHNLTVELSKMVEMIKFIILWV